MIEEIVLNPYLALFVIILAITGLNVDKIYKFFRSMSQRIEKKDLTYYKEAFSSTKELNITPDCKVKYELNESLDINKNIQGTTITLTGQMLIAHAIEIDFYPNRETSVRIFKDKSS